MNGVRILLRRSREELVERARLFAKRLRERYGDLVYAVYLIGSVARGEHGPRSDVDLVVVLRDPGSIPYTVLKTEAVEILDAPVDIIVLAPEALRLHREMGTRFYREICEGVKLV